jgi:hypothetical protein
MRTRRNYTAYVRKDYSDTRRENKRGFAMSEKLQISFESVLNAAANAPLVRIDREEFLRKQLSGRVSPEMVDMAVERGPIAAGVPQDIIEKLAKGSIDFETTKVTAISAAAGLPGGAAIAATIPADLAQFYAHVLRIAQKLAYLYGWDELFGENGMDDGTEQTLTLFIGVMSGVQMANAALNKVAANAAPKIGAKIAAKPLTKGAIYPIVKKVAGYLGVRMTKDVFGKGVSKIIPGIGAATSGLLTLATFKLMAKRLRKYLSEVAPIVVSGEDVSEPIIIEPDDVITVNEDEGEINA